MDFNNFRGLMEAKMQQMYHSPVKDGSRGVHGGFPGSMDTREAIQRELEKEMMRQEILAEEIARKRALEEEVRREIAMEMEMHHGGRFPSSIILKPPGRPFAPAEKYGGSGGQRREIGSFQAVPFQRLASPPGDGKKKVIDMGKLNGATASGIKMRSKWTCAVCKVSSECGYKLHLKGKKHRDQMATLEAIKAQRLREQQKSDGMIKLKNKSAEIGLGVAPEKPAAIEPKVLKSNKSTQPPLIKNSNKCVLKKEENKSVGKSMKQQFSFFCEMCRVEVSSDKTMNDHIKGKKHLNKLLKRHQEKESGSEKTRDSKEEHKAETEVAEKTQVEESESIRFVLADPWI